MAPSVIETNRGSHFHGPFGPPVYLAGRIVASGSAPFFQGSCETVPCPADTRSNQLRFGACVLGSVPCGVLGLALPKQGLLTLKHLFKLKRFKKDVCRCLSQQIRLIKAVVACFCLGGVFFGFFWCTLTTSL